MKTAQISEPVAQVKSDVGRALAAIAEHARRRQYEDSPGRGQDPLLSWERVAEFDKFRITVRCDYNVEPG
jgi:hypothetical protein